MKQLLFVHLAKTGGTSVRRILKASSVPQFDCIHHYTFCSFLEGKRVHKFQLEAMRLSYYRFAFLMVRHPLARLISCYFYFLAGGLNAQSKSRFFPSDLARQKFFIHHAPSLEQCCHKLDQIAESVPHFRPMSFWLDRLPKPLAECVFIGRQECFERDVHSLFNHLNVPLSQGLLQRSNSSPVRPQESPEFQLSSEALSKVHAFYAEDYQRFNYRLGRNPWLFECES